MITVTVFTDRKTILSRNNACPSAYGLPGHRSYAAVREGIVSLLAMPGVFRTVKESVVTKFAQQIESGHVMWLLLPCGLLR